MRRLRALGTSVLIATVAALAASAAEEAQAKVGLEAFDAAFLDAEGNSKNRAGTHPYAYRVDLRANTVAVTGGEAPDESVKNLNITQMPGFAGDQTAVPRCLTPDFLTGVGSNATGCPDATAVGLIVAEVSIGGGSEEIESPLYNLEPPPGRAAKLGFRAEGVPVTIEIGLAETPPYNIVSYSTDITQVLEFLGAEVTLWGVPADPVHDGQRGACYNTAKTCPAGIAPAPFITTPRACEGPLETHWEVDSWQHPGEFVSGFSLTHDDAEPPNPEGMSACGALGFEVATQATPSNSQAESATGLTFGFEIDDEGLKSPTGTANADIEALGLILPEGMTLNPSAAEGLGVCSEAQFEAESLESRACPGASKLGTVEAQTPILEDHPLRGSLYLAAQDDNPFGSLAAIYLVIRDPELGVFIKQAGEVVLGDGEGQVATFFEGLPPYPLSEVRTTLRSGPRAPLITPPLCGTYTTTAVLFPSSGAEPLIEESSFEVTSGPGGGPCPPPGTPPLAPGFEAGSPNNAAGAFSPFAMRLTRPDGSQDLTRFSAVLAPGVSGKIAGIPHCPDAAIAAAAGKPGRAELAAPSCPAASRLGSVLTGAGVGGSLTYVPGTVYLAGPYNGAPLSVVAIVPAVAGPFDVGTVLTRVALALNPDTAQVEVDGAASDPIPHILEGIVLKVRDIRIATDRPEFTLNPTSCAEGATLATIFGSGADPFSPGDDPSVPASSRYQAASCASLGFKPRLDLRLSGATRRAKNPGFRAELKARDQDANLKGAIVNLPPSLFIDNAHISNPCTRAQFAQDACPPRSVLGNARAFTPLLEEPLEGPVYFRSNGGERKLPDLVVALGGQFEFNLVIAVLQAKKGRIRTKVLNAPDAPVERFVLNMAGGRKGLLENSEFLCRKKQRAALNLIGQNGRRHKTRPQVKVKACARKAKRVRAHSRVR